MWQAVRKELHPRGLEVVSVALDTDQERARPFIEAARPEHPSLLDPTHLVDELFGIVNVPNSIWIDEQGMIVRPVDVANVQSSIEERVASGEISMPDDPHVSAMIEESRRLRFEADEYLDALRDWVYRGPASDWVLTPAEVIERSGQRSPERSEAAARFELGAHLRQRGFIAAAERHWREAHRLDPDNWTYKRQAWELVSPGMQAHTDVYESSWLEDVRTVGAENYYPPLTR